MKKFAWLFLSLVFVLTLAASSAMPRSLQPAGKKIGMDKQGNAIYQVHANGITIGYKLIGSGEPLVMIEGLGGTMDDWPGAVIDALAKKYQLILLDNRGIGHSTADQKTFTYKLFAGDVAGLLDALGVRKANVLGYSMGSVITQELLLDYPEHVNKAVIYATSADGTDVVTALKDEVYTDPIVKRQFEAIKYWKTPLDKLPSITNQVMLIVGTSDSIVGVKSSKMLASAIPGAWLVQFKNGTHFLIRQAPAEFAGIVSAFLDMNETVKVK